MTTTTPCLFCEIARGNTPAAVVAKGAGWTAFLDKAPLFFGHVLIVPNDHYETLVDLPGAEVPILFGAAKTIAAAVTKALGAQGTFVAMNNKVSQSVPHLHVHVVPRTKGDGLKGFFWPRKKYPGADEMETVRAAIARELEGE